MKKIFSIFAAALILFGAVSCKNKKDEPSAPKITFTIEISNITDEGCDFTITPSDNTVEYMRMFMSTEQLDNNTPAEVVESHFAALEVVYTELKNHGQIHQGRYGDTYTPLFEGIEYVLAAFQIDENLKVVGDVALSKSFYTLPEGFVDLGLPSGTLWQMFNTDNSDHPGYLWTWDEAMAKYASSIPTKEQWQELLDNCDWEWVDMYHDFYVSSRQEGNSNHIWVEAYGNGSCGSTGVNHKDEYTFYWSSTETGTDDATAYIGSKNDYNNIEDEFAKCIPLALKRVAPNPNKVQTIIYYED